MFLLSYVVTPNCRCHTVSGSSMAKIQRFDHLAHLKRVRPATDMICLQARLTMKQYVDYMRVQKDEMPLYVFDSKFAEKCPVLLSHYDPHTLPCFKENFLAPLGKLMRPDFRWLVVGPARSGAPWHIDPHHTSAWNVCLFGRKRWMLYPPSQVPPGNYNHLQGIDNGNDIHCGIKHCLRRCGSEER
jgi:hypothetical protein